MTRVVYSIEQTGGLLSGILHSRRRMTLGADHGPEVYLYLLTPGGTILGDVHLHRCLRRAAPEREGDAPTVGKQGRRSP